MDDESEYAPGEILVSLIPDFYDVTFDYFKGQVDASLPGLEYSVESFPKLSKWLLRVPQGEEAAYCRKLKTLGFIDGAERRDLTAERRADALDSLLSEVTGIRDDVYEMSRAQYNTRLAELIGRIEGMRE